MAKELSKLIQSLNYHFDQLHYIQKTKRKIPVLQKILVYNCEKYKEKINIIQTSYSQKGFYVKIRYQELVACAIAAIHNKSGVFGTSYKVLEIQKYHRKLRSNLTRLGEIGKVSTVNNCKNIIGKCAEVKAANNILQSDKKATIRNIKFSQAIRPRTLERIKRCGNCITIFGNEQN